MAKPTLGQFSRVKIAIEAPNALFVEVGRLISVQLPRTRAVVQANDNSNVQNVQKLPSRSDNKVTMTLNNDSEDAGQRLFRAAQGSGQRVLFKYMPFAEIGKPKFTGAGFATVQTDNTNDDQPYRLDFTIEVDGNVDGDQPDAPVIDANDLG